MTTLRLAAMQINGNGAPLDESFGYFGAALDYNTAYSDDTDRKLARTMIQIVMVLLISSQSLMLVGQ